MGENQWVTGVKKKTLLIGAAHNSIYNWSGHLKSSLE